MANENQRYTYNDNDTIKENTSTFVLPPSAGHSSIQKNMPVQFADITCAAFRIRNHIIRTPCTNFNIKEPENMNIYLKKEFTQVTGSWGITPLRVSDLMDTASLFTRQEEWGCLIMKCLQLVNKTAGRWESLHTRGPVILLNTTFHHGLRSKTPHSRPSQGPAQIPVSSSSPILHFHFTHHPFSFKERGACYALMMLSDEQKKSGVVTASLGNHSQALSYHAGRLGIPATVVMPVVAPLVKIEACKRFGARAIIMGDNMAEAKEYALKYCEDNNLTYINGYDDPNVIAGQGTIGLEIFEDHPDVDGIVIPVGGGGLIAGIALAAKMLNKDIKIIGVESDRCPSFSTALRHGKPVTADCCNSIADGLAVAKVGENSYNIASSLIDKMIIVKEEWISLTILRLLELEKCVVEGAGATGLAAVFCGELQEFAGKKLVVVLCGGNIDSNILGRCIERSLAADGRLIKFTVTISDRPGGVSDICNILAKLGVSIKDIVHERAWLTNEVFQVNVTITCETRDEQHVKEVKETLVKFYQNIFFADLPMLKL